MQLTRSVFLRIYCLPVFSATIALLVTLAIQPVMQIGGYSVLFLGAVMISARYGGLRSGLIAAILSIVSLHYFFIPPANSLLIQDVGSLVWLLIFALVAFLISSLYESLARAEGKLRIANQELEVRVTERTAELTNRNEELEKTLGQVRALKGMVTMCTKCMKIRSESGAWAGFEAHLTFVEHSEAKSNKRLCPECAKAVYPKYPFITESAS